MITVCFIQGTC